MTSYTTDVPTGVIDAGQDFNYAFWPANTIVTLGNVPWNADYRDVALFDTHRDLNDYLNRNGGSSSITIPQMSYARFGQPINIPIPFNQANKFNYILVAQFPHNDDGKYFAYFITHVEHVAPHTTRIYVQLDVWQTFYRSVQFGRAYVERGHVGIANEKALDNNGRDYLTTPEGLDLGGEYVIARSEQTELGENAEAHNAASVIVVSSVSLTRSGGDVNNPVLKSASGTTINRVPNGADVYYFENSSDFNSFLMSMTDKPWITQGIMAAYMIPRIARSSIQGVDAGLQVGKAILVSGYPAFRKLEVMKNVQGIISSSIPGRYKNLKKFQTYPYCFIEGTLHNATPLVMKPECLPDFKIKPHLEMQLAQMFTPPNPRLMLFPKNYNTQSIQSESANPEIANGEWLDFATGISNFPQISVVNNMYANYLATNKHAIEYQHRTADWAQSRVMAGANMQAGQASAAIGMNREMNRLSVNAVNSSTTLANQTAGYNALASGVSGAISQGSQGFARGGAGGAAGGVAGAVIGSAVGYGIQVNQNVQSASIQNQLSTGRTGATNDQAAYMRDTNLQFAEMASQGDYANAIAGINAKVQDAAMIQPTISGQSGGDAFNFSIQNGYQFVTKLKMIDSNTMTMIGEFWLRYGYAINRFYNINSNLMVMSKFTYWKVKELYLTSSFCPESFRQTIRGIFEKGVTVWKDADDIARARIDLNEPLKGIKL